MSADIIAGWDFKAKKRFKPEKNPIDDQIETISQELVDACLTQIDTPPEILDIIYESSIGFVTEKDPS